MPQVIALINCLAQVICSKEYGVAFLHVEF
jgi:hypothetical protein